MGTLPIFLELDYCHTCRHWKLRWLPHTKFFCPSHLCVLNIYLILHSLIDVQSMSGGKNPWCITAIVTEFLKRKVGGGWGEVEGGGLQWEEHSFESTSWDFFNTENYITLGFVLSVFFGRGGWRGGGRWQGVVIVLFLVCLLAFVRLRFFFGFFSIFVTALVSLTLSVPELWRSRWGLRNHLSGQHNLHHLHPPLATKQKRNGPTPCQQLQRLGTSWLI